MVHLTSSHSIVYAEPSLELMVQSLELQLMTSQRTAQSIMLHRFQQSQQHQQFQSPEKLADSYVALSTEVMSVLQPALPTYWLVAISRMCTRPNRPQCTNQSYIRSADNSGPPIICLLSQKLAYMHVHMMLVLNTAFLPMTITLYCCLRCMAGFLYVFLR